MNEQVIYIETSGSKILDLEVEANGSFIAFFDSNEVVTPEKKVFISSQVQFPLIRSIDSDKFLLADSRIEEEKHNAFIYDFNGQLLKSFLAGNGIEDILVHNNKIVVTYFDEGVFGADGPNNDGIQLYFDNGQLDTIVAIDSSGVYPFVNPQVSNPSGNILSDTMNWTLVSGMFTATGNETFLTIGNFKTDSNTQRVINTATYDPFAPINMSSLLIDDVSVIEVNVANWLHDTTIVIGDSVYIGLPIYEVPDALWYDINMNYIGKGSGIKVKPTQWATQYIQAIDVCSSIRYDTMTVWAAPSAIGPDPELVEGRQLKTFPNPVASVLNIELVAATNSEVPFTIYNTVGLIMKHGIIRTNRKNDVDLSALSPGIYYLACEGSRRKILKM
jgi:hypothetical protein